MSPPVARRVPPDALLSHQHPDGLADGRQDEVELALQVAHIEHAADVARVVAELRASPGGWPASVERVQTDMEQHLERAAAGGTTARAGRGPARPR